MSLLLATLFVVDLPLGPGSEAFARQLVAPYEHATAIDDGPWHLWDIRVQPNALHYTISRPHEQPAVTIHVALDAAAEADSAAVSATEHAGATPEAIAAGAAVQRALEARLKAGTVRFRQRAPPPQDHPVDVSTPRSDAPSAKRTPAPPLPGGTPRWLAGLLLLALASSIATYRRKIARILATASGPSWAIAAGLSVLLGVLLSTMDDVVLHPNAHGWDMVRSVVGLSQTPFPLWDRYGTFVIEVGRLLGFFAEPGRETFVASRLAAALSVFVLYGFALALLRSRTGALLAAGLFATSPVTLFVGRGEVLSAAGVLLMLLAAWLLSMAARRRALGLLVCGGIALACLANFRLMGPIMAPAIGLLALLPPEPSAPQLSTRTWKIRVLATWVGSAAIASPHLWRMGWLMTAELGHRPEVTVIPRTLLDSPMWTPAALLCLALAGLCVLAATQRWIAALLALWIACAVLAPASSAAFYQDQARYQVYAVPGLALAAAAALITLWRARRSAALVITAAWLVWFTVGQELAGQALATDQAEVTQLRLWRELVPTLPKGAWLAVPVATDGRARTALPDAELLGARPDIRLVSLSEARQAGKAPLFWFEGLSCAAQYPSDPPRAARDCLAARDAATLVPVRRAVVDPELPPELAQRLTSQRASLSPWPGDPTQWNPRPFPAGPVTIGLYRMYLRL